MTYKPRGKAKTLLDAMRAAADERPEWTARDVARVMGCATDSVPGLVQRSIRHGLLFHALETGRSRYSLTPLAPAAPTAAPRPATAPMAPRETTATGWRPPRMLPPRGAPA